MLLIFKGSLGFVPAVGDLAQYKSCAAKLGPYSLPYPQFSSLWQETFKCQLNSTEADPNLPVCPSDLNSRNETCLCDGSENFADVLPDVRHQISFIIRREESTTLRTPRNQCTWL